MENIFTREEMNQFGTVVWDDVLTQWNPKRTDVYTHFVAVMKAEGDNTYRAMKRHSNGQFELVSGERTFDDAVNVLMKMFSDRAA
tara:strand:- start:63 stop:317 length:255 start_codon:yes stop_codon:yes gene_type:complete